jgi:hypothetical protein
MFVIAMLGEHRTDNGNPVGVAGDVRQRLRELGAALAVTVEAERALEQVAGEAFVVGDLGRRRPIIVAVEHRLGVEQVDMAGTAMHEELNDGAGRAGKVRRPRLQRVRDRWGIRPAGPRLAEQHSEGQTAEAAAQTSENFAARVCSLGTDTRKGCRRGQAYASTGSRLWASSVQSPPSSSIASMSCRIWRSRPACHAPS